MIFNTQAMQQKLHQQERRNRNLFCQHYNSDKGKELLIATTNDITSMKTPTLSKSSVDP